MERIEGETKIKEKARIQCLLVAGIKSVFVMKLLGHLTLKPAHHVASSICVSLICVIVFFTGERSQNFTDFKILSPSSSS